MVKSKSLLLCTENQAIFLKQTKSKKEKNHAFNKTKLKYKNNIKGFDVNVRERNNKILQADVSSIRPMNVQSMTFAVRFECLVVWDNNKRMYYWTEKRTVAHLWENQISDNVIEQNFNPFSLELRGKKTVTKCLRARNPESSEKVLLVLKP